MKLLTNDVVWRAKTIVARKEVLYDRSRSSNNLLFFMVRQRDGYWTEVYVRKDVFGAVSFSCNAVDKLASWGCVLFKGDHSVPFCSHTLAVKYFIDDNGFSSWLDEEQKEGVRR